MKDKEYKELLDRYNQCISRLNKVFFTGILAPVLLVGKEDVIINYESTFHNGELLEIPYMIYRVSSSIGLSLKLLVRLNDMKITCRITSGTLFIMVTDGDVIENNDICYRYTNKPVRLSKVREVFGVSECKLHDSNMSPREYVNRLDVDIIPILETLASKMKNILIKEYD